MVFDAPPACFTFPQSLIIQQYIPDKTKVVNEILIARCVNIKKNYADRVERIDINIHTQQRLSHICYSLYSK